VIATLAESAAVSDICAMVQNISQRVQGTRVRMAKGKYQGRVAELSGAIINFDGQVAYLCYVERADGNGAINGDCASRSYLPADWFDVLEDEDA